MHTINKLKYIYDELKNGNIRIIDFNNKIFLNNEAIRLLNLDTLNNDDIEILDLIIRISNDIYHNIDNDTLVPIDDGVYDLLMVLISKYMKNYQVGSDDIIFSDSYKNITESNNDTLISPVSRIPTDKASFFGKNILNDRELIPEDLFISPIGRIKTVEKRIINTPHKYPELVGTLDKCKFVLNNQAIELGVFDDTNVRIFERDFIQKHIKDGIIRPDEKFYMVAELKYDGVSVEAEVTDRIISARSRGDTNNDIATDLTPILGGYRFPAANGMKDVIGMKFEAVLTNYNLQRLGNAQGKVYKNARNAIAGILGSSNGYMYRDYITLVPLEAHIPGFDNLDRLERIKILNNYYTTGIDLKYAILYGDYKEILFKVKRFVEEAETLRPFMPFLYDGVVISYIDKDKINKLGRENSVNKYSIAIKFNPMKHQTTFLGYTYTIGQSGVVTPMIHYNPVEFYGGIHTKSSGHSYKRFKELSLRKGDIIEVTYTNDVMPYVTKPDIQPNRENTNPIEEFPEICPCCGHPLTFTEKSAICTNINCKERNNARMENMLDKLQLKDFAGERLQSIGKYSLSELMDLKVDDVKFLGEINSQKFIERMNELKTKPIYDYQIVGALGFTGIAQEKWKLILTKFSLLGLMENYDKPGFVETLTSVKGIGPATANTIRDEMSFFIKDLTRIIEMKNIITSYGNNTETKVIRFTGFRDKDLIERLKSMGFDAGEGSVTKKTNILLIPCEGFTSTKTIKAEKDNIMIVPVQDFIANMDKYLY